MNQRIGHFRVIRQLGIGMAAAVYLAEDERNHLQVALKLLHPELTGNEHHVRRFRQEAEWISTLHHPNIVTIFELGEIEGRHYMSAEYVEGSALRDLIPPELPLKECVRIARGICSALDAAHEAWIVHRDVKPDNVMIGVNGEVKVVDFGLAKLTQPRGPWKPMTEPGLLIGTLGYLAPEQILGEAADPRTDLFSLGVVMYEMLTGAPPFDGATNKDLLRAVLKKKPDPLPSEIPAEVQWIVRKALEKDIDERYQSAAVMLEDLQRVEGLLARQ